MNAPLFHAPSVRAPLPAVLASALAQRFRNRFWLSQPIRNHQGRDESPYPPMPPDAVVFAETSEEVAEIIQLAAPHRVPIIPYGVGSSLEGHLLALHGGITIDLSRMNAVLVINAEDLTVTVQAGITRKQLNAAIKDTGLFFPIATRSHATM